MANFYGNDGDSYAEGGFTNYYGGDGRDLLKANASPNELYGGAGDDFLLGATYIAFPGTGTAADPFYYTVFAPSGNDYLEGGSGSDGLYGADGDDTIYGGDGNDAGASVKGFHELYFRAGLFGGDGNDRLDGGDGNDVLNGGNGRDVLTGGDGADQFLFDAALNAATNVDRMRDFEAGVDKIVLSATIFTAIGPHLAKGEFHVGKSAKNGDDHLIYNPHTGKLFYDPDGQGDAAKVQFALLDAHLDLHKGDFLISA